MFNVRGVDYSDTRGTNSSTYCCMDMVRPKPLHHQPKHGKFTEKFVVVEYTAKRQTFVRNRIHHSSPAADEPSASHKLEHAGSPWLWLTTPQNVNTVPLYTRI